MSRVWFSSDLHLGHRGITKYRTQFESVEEHDAAVAESLLTTVGKRDSLWLLGDLFFTEESLKWYDLFLNKFGLVNVVFGNHCTDDGNRQKAARYVASTANKFGSMFKYKGYWITHPPIHPHELRGKKNIHGHMHAEVLDDERYINVNMDVCGMKPILFEDLERLQAAQTIYVNKGKTNE